MLFGDPSEFAIAWESVDAWSNTTFKNGLLNVYVKFTLLGNRRHIVHALGTNLHDLVLSVERHETQKPLPESLVRSDPVDIFKWLCNLTYPREDHGQDSNAEYVAAPYCVVDEDDVLFLVKEGDQDHLYYGRYDGEYKGSISLSAGEYANVVGQAFEAYVAWEESGGRARRSEK